MKSGSKFIHLIEAVLHIAQHAKPNAVRGQEVCKSLGLPERYLEPEFQILVKHGILRSVRGPKGGYVLAKERRNISLADIYHGINDESEAGQESCISRALSSADQKYVEELARVSVESLCNESGQAATRPKADFTI